MLRLRPLTLLTPRTDADADDDSGGPSFDFDLWTPDGPLEDFPLIDDFGPPAPIGPIGPIDPAGPFGPIEPPGPIGPIDPTDPIGPIDPIDPIEPPGPIDPIDPFGPGF